MSEQYDVQPAAGEQSAEDNGFADAARADAEEPSQPLTSDASADAGAQPPDESSSPA